jgi:acetyl esterase/lipase
MDLMIKYYDSKIILKRALDIALPKSPVKQTALFFIHGGGYFQGLREHFHYHLEHFSERGHLCCSAGYRLVPSVTIREQLEDIITGYERFVEYIRENNLGIKHVMVIGSSAGAHLATLLALNSLMPAGFAPSACVSINGPGRMEKWPDMNGDVKRWTEEAINASYDRESDSKVFRGFCPLRNVRENAPDFLFLLAGKEPYFPHKYIDQLSEQLKQFNSHTEIVTFPEANHGFFYELKTDVQKQALSILENFIERYS